MKGEGGDVSDGGGGAGGGGWEVGGFGLRYRCVVREGGKGGYDEGLGGGGGG